MHIELDQDGHLLNHHIWDAAVAQHLANSLALQLSPWHFEVLAAVRQFYTQFGHAPATRPLIKFLQKELAADIDNTMLQQRFQTGLVARHLSRLAGIPKPTNCL